jgi:type IV secretory pathway VirD2 relaxase
VSGDDDLPIFRPRFGRGRGKAGRAASTTFRNAVLLTSAYYAGRAARRVVSPGARRPQIPMRAPRPQSRRVVVKARFVKMTRSGAKAAALHLRYIERDGVEKDGSKGVLYGPDGPVRADSFEEPRPGEKRQYRLIVSPEDAAELDLTAFVRSYMARVERDLGQPLEWAAVNHHDTDHPHAHIVVRGVDARGHDVRFDRAYVSQGLRWRAQELATQELGPRSELEIRQTRAKETTQERYTSLDRDLERRTQGNVVTLRGREASRARGGADESTLLARLTYLETLRLAERTSATSWVLAEGWTGQLRESGIRGDILKQMHLALRGDPSRYRIVPPGRGIESAPSDPPGTLYGRVASKGLSDELAGRYYAVLETPGGSGYHVPLDARAAESLRPGDLVAFASKPDRSPARDAGAPRQEHVVVRSEALTLEEQVRYRGPVPLDRLARQPLAPYGFGAEVRRAAEERAAVLRALGIEPDDPDRTAKLREIERRDLGDRIAARSGQSFLPKPPGSFQGRVQLVDRGADGTPYAVVSDGMRFVMVQASADLRTRDGRSVLLRTDRDGNVRAHDPDKDLSR